MDITSINNNLTASTLGTAATSNSTSGTASSSNSTLGAAATSNMALDESQFLQLLTTQLQYQDPLNPMDSTDFTSQLAQFSSLEQMTNISQQMSDMLQAQNYTLSANLIGKNVTVSNNSVSLASGGTATISYNLAQNASTVTASLYDANGTLVNQINLGPQNAGNDSFVWNGNNSGGQALPAGQYTVQIAATNASGQSVTSSTMTSGTVTGIAINNNTTYLVIGGQTQVPLNNVQQINAGGS
ncbi:MAG: flagellar hook capping FlgD N-terminal domain-containing protein [Thermodesulfovibrionales bacterium]|jgi:flagellar basal-body rod modification protein FlgD